MDTPARALPLGGASRGRARTRSGVLIVAGSLLAAGLAQVGIGLPFTPVPVTGQTLGVPLEGGALGPVAGASSMLLYLAEGAMGLPFFAEGRAGVAGVGLVVGDPLKRMIPAGLLPTARYLIGRTRRGFHAHRP